eukprot:m.254887 g.254887  ORF g.254887 m.254887 type:complete len:393 (-) comp15944_c0_seq4:1268-2446(-)
MANRTMKDAASVHATNPQYLVEKIIRSRIYDSLYWKESCFALTAESLIDRATELKYVGGVSSGLIKPTPFMCLTLKLLQIQPEKEIILEYIANTDFKYLRCLGAFYLRLVGTAMDCYTYLEPILKDFRKIKRMKRDGGFELIHVDEFIDELLTEERVCDIILPRISSRFALEMYQDLDPYDTSLLDELGEDDDDDAAPVGPSTDAAAVASSPPPPPPADRRRSRSRDRSPSPRRRDHGRRRERSPSPRRRSRSRSPARRRRSRSPRHRRSRSPSRERRRRGSRSPSRDRRRRRSRSPRSSSPPRRRKSRSYSPRSPRGRSPSPSRERRRSRSPSPTRGSSRGAEKPKKHRLKFKGDKKKEPTSKPKKANTEVDEIAAANALRAKLGLAPLRP